MNFDSINYDIVGLELPNGKVQVVKNKYGEKGKVFEHRADFEREFQPLNESVGASSIILESING